MPYSPDLKSFLHTKIDLYLRSSRLWQGYSWYFANYVAGRTDEIKKKTGENERTQRERERVTVKISVKDTPTQLELLDLTVQLIVGGN